MSYEPNMSTYYGPQTMMALENFRFTSPRVHKELIYEIIEIKKAAARANWLARHVPKPIFMAIDQACTEALSGAYDDQFQLPSLQGGAGTSIHMNVNEVIANRAAELSGLPIHPNDHVNMSQSTNDVVPSALKLASIDLTRTLLGSATLLTDALETKAREFNGITKLGRTHLQDAVPITLGDEFRVYADTVKHASIRIKRVLEHSFFLLNLGGTAVGLKTNTSKSYRHAVYKSLNKQTGLTLAPAPNLMAQTSVQSDFVALSQAVTLLALDTSKIASDLRLLSSGPLGGIGEITIAEAQPGSTIMPGKANPVFAETVNQLYYIVSGNNLTVEHAAAASQLELGVMLPVMADKLLASLKMSGEVLRIFAQKCIATLTANPRHCRDHLERSTAYATAFSPLLGYDTVSRYVHEAIETDTPFLDVLASHEHMSKSQIQAIIKKSSKG